MTGSRSPGPWPAPHDVAAPSAESATDIFAGWGSLHGRDYYVRQSRDMKIIPTTDLIAPRLVQFATACGETLYADQNARDHAQLVSAIAAGTVESLPG